MNPNLFLKRSLSIVFFGLAVFTTLGVAQRAQSAPTRVVVSAPKPMTVAGGNSLYCAGFVQASPINTEDRIVGAVEEQEQFMYAQNDYVYVNMGTSRGMNVGDMLAVVRPRGRVDTRWTNKDELGFLVQEVGALEIVKIRGDVSVARVRASCDVFLLGDLVQPMPQRQSPMHQDRGPMNPFIDASGKARGRLFMSRDGAEMLSRDQIVYIDLGAEDNVQVGDKLTVFRPLGRGHLFISDEKESLSARVGGFQSNEFRGGTFSNQAARKSGDQARGRVVTTEKAKEPLDFVRESGDAPRERSNANGREHRPQIRKVVGEIVILNVKEKTATAVITRTVQEIHTGDWVELQ